MFLNNDLSWTMSKALPYGIMVLSGVLLALIIARFLKLKGALRYVSLTTVSLIPFIVYFAVHPIYEGDFANNGKKLSMDVSYEDFKEEGIYMISIPNCPYCYESLDVLLKLQERMGDGKVKMLICSSDSGSIEWYEEKVLSKFLIRLAVERDKLADLVEGRFPAFALKTTEGIKIWSNSEFGVRALDEVEKELK